MDQLLTQLNIPAYIYNETTEVENLLIEAEMLRNEELQEEVSAALQVKKELDRFQQNPSDSTIDFLLNYSLNLGDQMAALN